MKDMKDKIFIPTLILNIFIIIISFYLTILYIKSKTLHIYPCYNFLILSFVIFLDNIFRIIPLDNNDVFKYIQAFLLTSLDKLILSIIIFETFIIYLGVVKTKFYYKNEKIIFFSGLISNLIISFTLGGIFVYISDDLEKYGIYYYCEGNYTKKIIDLIYNSIYLFINTFCILILLLYMSTKKEEAEEGIIEDLDYGRHYMKILLMFIFNSLAFIESYLIIYDKLPVPDEYIDLVYLVTCLLIDLFYTLNKIIYKETLKIFCRNIYDKKYPQHKNNSSNSTEDTKTEVEMKDFRSSSI